MVDIIKYDRIIEFLSNLNGIDLELSDEFNRFINFKIRGNYYTIEWYKNYVTLHIGGRDFSNPSLNFRNFGIYTYSCRSSESLFFYDDMKDSIFNKVPNIKFEIPITKNSEVLKNIIPNGLLIA